MAKKRASNPPEQSPSTCENVGTATHPIWACTLCGAMLVRTSYLFLACPNFHGKLVHLIEHTKSGDPVSLRTIYYETQRLCKAWDKATGNKNPPALVLNSLDEEPSYRAPVGIWAMLDKLNKEGAE